MRRTNRAGALRGALAVLIASAKRLYMKAPWWPKFDKLTESMKLSRIAPRTCSE
jgi:hypothetical protein